MANNSQDVREVQEKLRAISFGDQTLPLIAVDGVYGPMTSLSVSAFQQRDGLPVTGKVDLTTWRAINDSYEQRSPTAVSPNALRRSTATYGSERA